MQFHFTSVKNVNYTKHSTVNIPVGGNICGLMQDGQRPHSVTLTGKELIWLYQNPEYMSNQLLHRLQQKETE